MASIPQPGLQIQQVLSTVTPTIFSPTFPACIVGPCYQIIEMQDSDGSLNSSASLSLPARIASGAVGATFVVSAAQDSVYLEIDGVNREYTFTSYGTLSAATMVSKLNEGFAGYAVWSSPSATQLAVRTVSSGDAASIMFRTGLATDLHTILAFNTFESIRYYGNGDYENNPIVFPYLSLPDTRGIISYLTFDGDNINIARIWAGTIVTLSDTSAINRNRYNRVGIAYNRGNGGALSASAHTYLGAENFYMACGEVIDSGSTTVGVAKPLYNATPLTGNEWDLSRSPNNQLLWPIGSGSTSNQLLQTGRHAYADVQLSADGVTASAYYHFEGHGYQKYVTDQSVTPGSVRGAFGNLVSVKFIEVDLDGGGNSVLNDGQIAFASNPDTFYSTGGAAGVHGTGDFVAGPGGDVGKYIYLHDGAVGSKGWEQGWYLISAISAGTGPGGEDGAVLQTTAAVALGLAAPADDTSISWTMSDADNETELAAFALGGAYTLPYVHTPVADPLALTQPVIYIEYATSDATNDWDPLVALDVPSFVTAAGLNTAMLAKADIESFFGPNTTVGGTAISYLSGTSTAILGGNLDDKRYFLNFGADPNNYAATSATFGYPYVMSESSTVDAGPLIANESLAGRTFTVRVNGGPERSHTFVGGGVPSSTCDSQANIATALNALVPGGTPFAFTSNDAFTYGSEVYAGTGTLVNTLLTDGTLNVPAHTFAEAERAAGTMHVQIWPTGGAAAPAGSGFGVYEVVTGIAAGTGVITLASNLAGAGPLTVGYRLLVTTGNVLACALDSAMCSTLAGFDSSIEFSGDAVNMLFRGPYSTATTDYTGRIFRGDPVRSQIGDKVYNAGTYVGDISSFSNVTWTDSAVGAQSMTNGYINLTEKNATVGTALGTWYISSQGITGAATDGTLLNTTVAKPLPEAIFNDNTQLVTLKGGLNRDAGGVEYSNSTANLAAGYTALRTDITVSGASPAVQVYSTYAEMNTAIGPVSSSNPLALGVYLAMLNAPNIQVSAFGVDATSTLMPNGTMAAYATAFDFIQSANVYAIAPMSESPAVHGLLDAHVTAMADPTTGKSERVCFVCEDTPTEQVPTTVGSAPGQDDPYDVTADTFKLAVDLTTGFDIAANLSGELDATGATVPILGSVTIANGLYCTREGDALKYSVSEIIAGNILKFRTTGFAPGSGPGTSGNDDNFYSTTLPSVSAAWDADDETVTLYIRQAAIDTTTSTGRAQLAAALASKATSYAYRRVRYVQPDSATYLQNGASTSIHGMYACAALAGLCSSTPPQQSFSTLTLAGLESISGSWDLLSQADMDTAAGGGVWWLIQQDQYSAVENRHQLTTDVTSLQTREASVTHVLDYITKRLRVSMQGLAGKFNLTKAFLDYVGILVSTIIDGMSGSIVSNIGVTSIRIDPQVPDTMYVDISVTPYYPANQIKVTLVV